MHNLPLSSFFSEVRAMRVPVIPQDLDVSTPYVDFVKSQVHAPPILEHDDAPHKQVAPSASTPNPALLRLTHTRQRNNASVFLAVKRGEKTPQISYPPLQKNEPRAL